MAKISLKIPGRAEPLTMDWQADAEGRFGVQWPEGILEGTLTLTAPGEGWLETGGRIRRFYLTRRGDTLEIWLDGQNHIVELQASGARREAATHAAGFQGEIKAPMPGSIVKVAVQAGERVSAHQTLVILESMKMEMTLSAHADGTVRAVRCTEGQLVALGDILVELAP